jgi:hypothetical protein
MSREEIARCEGCYSRYYKQQMESVDISLEDEYYPKFIYLCSDCSEGSGE